MQAVIDKIIEIEVESQAEIAFLDTPSLDVLSEKAKSKGIKVNHIIEEFENQEVNDKNLSSLYSGKDVIVFSSKNISSSLVQKCKKADKNIGV